MPKMVNISFSVDEGVILSARGSKEEFTRDIQFYSALFLYRKRRLSLGKAAQLAGYNRIEFIGRIQTEMEEIFDYSEEELREISEDTKKIP